MSDFDDRSGVVAFNTEWGKWSQTMDEVWIHVNLVEGTRAKDIRCDVSTKNLDLCVKGHVTFQVTGCDFFYLQSVPTRPFTGLLG